jgi:hypothetical protein
LTLVVNDPVFESDAAAHRPSSADSPTPLSWLNHLLRCKFVSLLQEFTREGHRWKITALAARK